jgi:hypothetical protein
MVLAHVQLVTITFADDPERSTEESFGDWVVASDWLATIGRDYGVGTGTNQNVEISFTASTSLALNRSVGQFLRDEILDGTLPPPQPAAPGSQFGDTVYLIYYPPFTPNVLPANAGGYHACESTEGPSPAQFGYAVVQGSSRAAIEAAASHEIAEAAIDPCGIWGYRTPVASESSWTFLGGEVGDLCFNLFAVDPSGHTVQRIWSTSAAGLGADPCIPASAAPYFNTAATPSAIINIPAGTSTVVALQGWSTAPTADWPMTAVWAPEFSPPVTGCGVSGPLGPFDPDAQLSATMMNNGGTATLRVTVPPGRHACDWGTVLIYSGGTNFWPVVVRAL